MKNLLLFIFLLAGIQGFSQETFIISGNVQYDSFHQGGAEKIYFPQPKPLTGYSLLLLRFNDGDSIPQVVEAFTTDELGEFALEVKPGTYGFSGVNDTLKANQYLPQGSYIQDEGFNSSSNTWSYQGLNYSGPIVVTNKDVNGVSIFNYRYSVCGMCP